MAFVRLAFFPDGTLAQYEAMSHELATAPIPPGRHVFAAGQVDGGIQVVQVWDSREALEAFNRDWLRPALARLGDRGLPMPQEIRDFETVDARIVEHDRR